MESAEGDATTFEDPDDEHLLTGQCACCAHLFTLTFPDHAHPYGEVNCVIPIRGDHCELEGLNGWQHAGWTSPGPGSHHYPRVRNGALVAMFLLPAGRISCASSIVRTDPADDRRLGQAVRLPACRYRRRRLSCLAVFRMYNGVIARAWMYGAVARSWRVPVAETQ